MIVTYDCKTFTIQATVRVLVDILAVGLASNGMPNVVSFATMLSVAFLGLC